ncbi:YndJ family transporter [Natrinema sp. 1APR25-10V2]|uniref:YndJ family transporter n=1 Tax=Natrinema sp. 1APR25-10V2 TaxID=2951081 RepID=UPI002875AB3E|nr:YndJ family transporter [Natrinema sp. 1APR25-10V2]MDS0476088.1 YndJ family protein [Natrinema sp. 1APR25-10V2]
MTDLEATPARTGHSSQSPTVAGRRVTDLSALVGGGGWLVLSVGTIGGPFPLSAVELYVALATLVVVPLGLGLLESRAGDGSVSFYTVAVGSQFPAAVAVVAGLAAPRGTLAAVALTVPWLAVTGSIALVGLRRLLVRGPGPLPELAIDASLLYVPVAAVFLCLHAAEISLRFAPIIVLLTGVHFHYAGFALPLIVGFTGRIVATDEGEYPPTLAGRAAAAVTAVIAAGVLLIAVGITFSPVLEAVAAAAFSAAVVGFALLVFRAVVPAVPRLPGALFSVAALSLCWTMALALAFASSAFPGTASLVSIPEMIRWHGSVNAFGFALPVLLAARLLEN